MRTWTHTITTMGVSVMTRSFCCASSSCSACSVLLRQHGPARVLERGINFRNILYHKIKGVPKMSGYRHWVETQNGLSRWAFMTSRLPPYRCTGMVAAACSIKPVHTPFSSSTCTPAHDYIHSTTHNPSAHLGQADRYQASAPAPVLLNTNSLVFPPLTKFKY